MEGQYVSAVKSNQIPIKQATKPKTCSFHKNT